MTQLTDRELLEGAAKVGGYEWDDYCEKLGLCYYPNKSRPECASWNPLTDDGDALRLAVKLRMEFFYGYNAHKDSEAITVATDDSMAEIEELISVDPYAATRRAITRTAYEIGKEKK